MSVSTHRWAYLDVFFQTLKSVLWHSGKTSVRWGDTVERRSSDTRCVDLSDSFDPEAARWPLTLRRHYVRNFTRALRLFKQPAHIHFHFWQQNYKYFYTRWALTIAFVSVCIYEWMSFCLILWASVPKLYVSKRAYVDGRGCDCHSAHVRCVCLCLSACVLWIVMCGTTAYCVFLSHISHHQHCRCLNSTGVFTAWWRDSALLSTPILQK